MTTKVSIGGNRLGSGNKMDLHLKNFERSNHDLGYVWRSTMACGTLVPFMTQLALPGDTFDIELDADVKTYPTVGPLFGSFKMQMDVFSCPIRLYQGMLHNNPLGVGMKMGQVHLPQMKLETKNRLPEDLNDLNTYQINPSSLLAYLGIRGIGADSDENQDKEVVKHKNAISYLAYWDIYKNYYANKQEEAGACILASNSQNDVIVTNAYKKPSRPNDKRTELPQRALAGSTFVVEGRNIEQNYLEVVLIDTGQGKRVQEYNEIFGEINVKEVGGLTIITGKVDSGWDVYAIAEVYDVRDMGLEERISVFPLKNIDDMRSEILSKTKGEAVVIDKNSIAPYGNIIGTYDDGVTMLSNSQQGLALKTYQSDIFNNWVSTEWIDGAGGVAEVSAIDVSDGTLKIDALILAKKVHNMLNRVAVSGGSYYDWINAVYSQSTSGMTEVPTYHGGLSKEVVFEEVISQAETAIDGVNPLGTLAGKGRLSNKHKGGKVYVKVDEPSYIIGIVSLTPRIDYSQGNAWDSRLKTMDDLHKPSLDGIGFQDLITEKMAWWDTQGLTDEDEILHSAGKQPAWLDYMTNFNKTYGHFANKNSEMFMTLNRRYEVDMDSVGAGDGLKIKDLTTYIDPSKFNYAFAMTDITSQNFWVQIGADITARRKVSAKQIPNL